MARFSRFKGFGSPHEYTRRKRYGKRFLQKDSGTENSGHGLHQGGSRQKPEPGTWDTDRGSEEGIRSLPLHLQSQGELRGEHGTNLSRNSQASHSEEWVTNSAIGADITELNLVSLDSYAPFERLFYSDKIKRLNTGRLPSWVLNKYSHLEHGGWWCSGVDPVTGLDDLWGCFKPDHPRIDATKGKHQKYEHPYKAQATLFALKVTDAVWQKVASRYGVEVLPTDIDHSRGDRGFWNWVIRNPKIPVTVTEGVKKAACLLSQGFAAIGLPGIWGGYRKNEGKPSLIPQLKCFATKARQIYFAFDQDEKRSTRQSNRKAVWCTAKLLKDLGCDVRIVAWEPQIKGVDDLIVAKGSKHFTACYQKALAFDDWMADGLRELTYKPALRLDSTTKYIGEFAPPPHAKLICLKAPKGSGKTEWLVKICADAQHRGQKVLILTHRTQLGRALCDRFGIDYVEELGKSTTKGIFGIGLCFDSLRANSQARFDPEDWYNCIVILDEVEQSVWHLLNANTEVGKHRVQVLRNFQQLIQNVMASEDGKVYLSDADLSDVTIDYIRSLISFPVEPWIALKEGNPTPWDVTAWGDCQEMLGVLVSRIPRGEKPLIFVDGQKTRSKWGTQNLEAYLSKEFPDLKILRVDADSVSTPGHPAYDCIDQLDEILKDFDACVASPTIETGVSIDLKGHFTSVWDFAQGVIPVPSVLQRMARLREPVPRHVWAKGYGLGRIGNGSTSPKRLIAGQHTKFQAHIKQLAEADFTFDFESAGNFQPQSLKTWAKMAARINLGMVRYQYEIIRALVAEGHNISTGDYLAQMSQDEQMKGTDEIKEELAAVRDKNYQQQCYEISQFPTPDTNRLKTLKEKKAKSLPERLEQRKGELAERYDESVISSELVELDDQGEYSKAQLHYYLTSGEEFLGEREKTRMERLLEAGENELFCPDVNRSMIGGKLAYLKALGILQLLAQDVEWSNDSQVLIDLAIKTKQFRESIKDVLGLSFNFERIGKDGEPLPPSPISIAQKFLRDCLGLKFSSPVKRGGKGCQQRFYQPVEVPELRQKILEVWRQRDEHSRAAKLAEQAEANFTTQALTISDHGGFVSTPDTVSTTGNNNIYVSAAYQDAAYQDETVGEVSLVEQIGQALPWCDRVETLAECVQDYGREAVELAIALQDDQPRRQQLTGWLQQLAQSESTAGQELAQAESIQGELLRDRLRSSFNIPAFRAAIEDVPAEKLKSAIENLPGPDRDSEALLRSADRVSHYWRYLRSRGECGVEAGWKQTTKLYGQLLLQGFEYGVETIKDLLTPWTPEERRGAITPFPVTLSLLLL
ncbi:MAG TPA: plasmid replication protein, CyRepA1 family [Waterburya sp.]